MKSSDDSTGDFLARHWERKAPCVISPNRLEAFLVEMTNFEGSWEALARLTRTFGDFIPETWIDYSRSNFAGENAPEIDLRANALAVFMFSDTDQTPGLVNGIRRVWEAADRETAYWRTFVLQFKLYDMEPKSLTHGNKDLDPPPWTPVQQALSHLRNNFARLRRCGNPMCVAPYFFAAKKNQRYCSDACALPAQREAKKAWWSEHGSLWRSKRKSKNEKPRRAGARTPTRR